MTEKLFPFTLLPDEDPVILYISSVLSNFVDLPEIHSLVLLLSQLIMPLEVVILPLVTSILKYVFSFSFVPKQVILTFP